MWIVFGEKAVAWPAPQCNSTNLGNPSEGKYIAPSEAGVVEGSPSPTLVFQKRINHRAGTIHPGVIFYTK